VVPVGVAIWQLVSGQGNREIEGLNRLQGTFSHPNTFGPFLVPFIAVTLWQAQTSRGLSRLSSVIGAALLTLLLAMTYSRTAVLVALGMAHPLVGHGAGMTIVLNPMINGRTGLPYNAHNDFVRVFFEGGALGLVSYVVYGVLLCKWALQKARHAPVHQAPRSN